MKYNVRKQQRKKGKAKEPETTTTGQQPGRNLDELFERMRRDGVEVIDGTESPMALIFPSGRNPTNRAPEGKKQMPLTLEDALNLLGVESVEGDQELFRQLTEELVQENGEEWVRQNRERLLVEWESI